MAPRLLEKHASDFNFTAVKLPTFFFSILGRRCQRSGRRRRRQRRRRQLGRVSRRRRRRLDDRRTLFVLDLAFGGRARGHERVEAFRDGRRTEMKNPVEAIGLFDNMTKCRVTINLLVE